MAFRKACVSSATPSPRAPNERMLTQVSIGGSAGISDFTGSGRALQGIAVRNILDRRYRSDIAVMKSVRKGLYLIDFLPDL